MKMLRDQSGIALALSLMVILTLTVLVSGMMLTVVNDKTITANHVRDARALAVAKAGTAEVVRRLGQPYAANDTVIIEDQSGSLHGDWQCLIFLNRPTSGGSGSVMFKRSMQQDTLPYSVTYQAFAADQDTDRVLRVKYKTFDANGNGVIEYPNEIYFYDYIRKQISLGRGNPTPGDAYPVWEIYAPAVVGNARRTLVTEVVVPRYNAKSQAGLSADGLVWVTGSAVVCGHNHLYTTPSWTQPTDCFDDWHIAATDSHAYAPTFESFLPKNHCTAVGCVPAIETMGVINNNGANTKAYGNPDSISGSSRPTLKLWEILGMDSASCVDPANWTTNDPVNGWSKFTPEWRATGNSSHEGIAWVVGDCHIAGNMDFKGLIYIEGDLFISGRAWILGGITVRGTVHTTTGHGNMTILYSSEAIARAVTRREGVNMSIWSQREL